MRPLKLCVEKTVDQQASCGKLSTAAQLLREIREACIGMREYASNGIPL
jgi:hypothetical protein